jgi:SSS family solute:Na+ symporter
MGVVSTVYTLCGGLKGVVWTDVAQGTLFFLGAAAAVAFAPVEARRAGRRRLRPRAGTPASCKVFTLEGDWLASTHADRCPSAIVAGLFLNLASPRHRSGERPASPEREAAPRAPRARSIVSGLFTFPVVATFLAVGTVLWAYHAKLRRRRPTTPPTPSASSRTSSCTRCPPGLRGLVFAGLFAAAISSLAATLNATTTAWVTDLVRRLPRSATPRFAPPHADG